MTQYIYPYTKVNLENDFIYSPFFLLTVQKPLRLAFKKIFKREPVIEREPNSFEDFVYTVLLFFAVTLLPLMIV
jgi:hypothetical protein